MTDGRITAQVELWRERGSWRMILHAPRWLISDIAVELHPSDIGMTVANWGGPSDSDNHTLLLVPYRFGGPGKNPIGSALDEPQEKEQTNDSTE